MPSNDNRIGRSGHDFCSPSQLDRRYHCPGSVRLEQALEKPDRDGSTEAARRGTILHDVARKWLTVGDAPSSEELQQYTGPQGYVPTDEDMEDVAFCVGSVLDIIDELRAEYPNAKILCVGERQVDLSDLGISGGTEGCRVDYLIVVVGIMAVLIDYKFGAGYVSQPAYNPQFQAYSWAVWQNYGVPIVRAIKLQPAADEEYQQTEAIFTPEQLETFGDRIREIVEATKEPDAPLVRGRWCTFCAAKSVCPQHRDTFLALPQHRDIAVHMAAISPKDRGDIIDGLEAAKSWVEKALNAARAWAIENPDQRVEGYELKESAGNRTWTDEQQARKILTQLADEKGKDASKLLVPEALVTPAQAEKVLGKSKSVKVAMAEVIITEGGKTSLKRVSRPT